MKFRLILIIFIILLIGFFIWQGIYLPKDFSSAENKMFSIEKGENFFEVAENLEKQGIIKNKFFFDFYVLANGSQNKLQAGDYSFAFSENISEIAKTIISGNTEKIEITIPEGFTVKQVEERLNLKLPEGENLEGFLFPDTYQFLIGVSGEEAVRKMKDNFDKKITQDLRKEIEEQGKTIFEIVTMASLLEKEVKTKEEKELAADVLWKRLEIGMPLQVDAAMETYDRLGLPAGPICNPGLESIMAAVYPEKNGYWYYLSTPEGETIFSKTLKEHNEAKAEHLR